MFRFTQEPSSGSYKCLAKITVVHIGTDVVSVIAAYSDLLCVCVWFTVTQQFRISRYNTDNVCTDVYC